MPHITKIIDSAQIHTREFKQLRDMVIDLHFQNQPINPLYIAALVAVINIFGLWLIFKLNKKKELHILETNIKKEINIEVAKLYGKFKAMSLSYINIFYQYDGANATYNYYCFLKNYFTSCSRDADYMSSMDAEDINNFYERLNDILKKESSTLKTSNEKFEDFKNKKVALFEVLHQISFYYKDDKLNKMINDVQSIYTNKFKVEEYSDEMLESGYLTKYDNNFVKPNSEKLKIDIDAISAKILELSKK